MSIIAKLNEELYANDFYAWSQDQAKLLRSLSFQNNTLPQGLDLETIAEEIEDLGRSDLHKVESQTQNIFVHLIKAASDPGSLAYAHWRTETLQFQTELSRRYTPSMRQNLDLEEIWRSSLQIAKANLLEWSCAPRAGLPDRSPFGIEALVSRDFNFDQAVEWLMSIAKS